VKERHRRIVLQSARAEGDGMIRPPGHLITGAGREEVMGFMKHVSGGPKAISTNL